MTFARAFSGFTGSVLDRDSAAEIVDRIDVDALPMCSACHLEVAFALVDEAPPRVVAPKVTRACSWVWPEIEVELLAQLRRAAMRGQAWADDALVDLGSRRGRSWIVREFVVRFASSMADEMRSRGLGSGPRPTVLTFPRSRR